MEILKLTGRAGLHFRKTLDHFFFFDFFLRKEILKEILPSFYLNSSSVEFWEEQFVEIYHRLRGISSSNAKWALIATAQSIPFYGVTLYPFEEGNLGVLDQGIMICSTNHWPNYQFVSYNELKDWKVTSDGFSLNVEKDEDPIPFLFKCEPEIASAIFDLVSGYWLLTNKSENEDSNSNAQVVSNFPSLLKSRIGKRSGQLLQAGQYPLTSHHHYLSRQKIEEEPFGSKMNHFCYVYRRRFKYLNRKYKIKLILFFFQLSQSRVLDSCQIDENGAY